MYLWAIFLACLIFVVWGLIGYGVVREFGQSYDGVRIWLLSPAAGVSICALLVNQLNRIGLPIKNLGWPLLAALLAASAVYLVLRKPRLNFRAAIPWFVVLGAALLTVGWPLIAYGFNWTSFGNGDMTNYLVGAEHFYRHGYYDVPALKDLLNEADPTWDTSFKYSLGEIRAASQMILALVMATTGLTSAQAYMPLTVAFHLTVLTTTAALICSTTSRRAVAMAATLIVATSANLALGTFQQLMPQNFGITTLAASALVLMAPPRLDNLPWKRAALAGLFIGALLLSYPELLPILGFAAPAYAALTLLHRETRLRDWLVFIALVLLFVLVFANRNLPGVLHQAVAETHYAQMPERRASLQELFPYYLTPIGAAMMWGFIPYGAGAPAGWFSQATILGGLALCAVAAIAALWSAWRMEPVACVAGTMILAFIDLFAAHSGFGLLKDSMYLQPFVIGTLTILAARVFQSDALPIESTRL